MERLTSHYGENYAATELDYYSLLDIPDEDFLHLQDIVKKLASYEDAEEQGLLLRLPVPIWTEVHAISKCLAHNCEKCIAFGWNEHCFPEFHGKIYTHPMTYSDIPKLGKKVFLTKAEAEKALAEMG